MPQKMGLMTMLRRWFTLFTLAWAAAMPAWAQTAPDELIRQLSTEVIDAVKADKAIQAGDVARINELVDAKVMPHVDFRRMTALSVGRHWRSATPEQQQRLQQEFKLLLVRSYAGALTQVKDQTVHIKPMRAQPADTEVVVRTEIKSPKGKGEPVQLDYRLEHSGGAWKIFDVNVLGVWLVDQYRTAFSQDIAAGGIDGLIAKLAERNKGGTKS